MATHVTACDVRVIWQMNGMIMHLSLHKSATIAKRCVAIYNETTAHGMKEAKALFEYNMMF